MISQDWQSPGIFSSQHLTSYLDQHTSLRARNQVKSVSQDRFKNNASAPVRNDLQAGVSAKIESDYRDAVTRNSRHLNRSEVNLTKQAMYPQAQNYMGRNNAASSRKSDRSNQAAKVQNKKPGNVRKLLDKVEGIRHGQGEEDLYKRLPLQAGLYLEHPSIFKGKKKEPQVNQSQSKVLNSDIEEHRRMLRKFPSSPFQNMKFLPMSQVQKKQEPVVQTSPMSPQFDYLVARSFLQAESTEIEQRAQRISKLQALCFKTASAVQELKNEVRKGNFELPQQTIGTHSQSQTTATHHPKKRNKIMTPIDLVNTGINLLYATQRVDGPFFPDIAKLNSQELQTPKPKRPLDDSYGGLLMPQDASSFVHFGNRAQSAAQRKRQTNMLQLFKKSEGTESLTGLLDNKKRRIQSAMHRPESESGTGIQSQLLKNYLRPQSSDTRLMQHEIQYLSEFIEKRLKETNVNNLQPSKLKKLIEGAIQQFLAEKQKQMEIETPLQKIQMQAMKRSSTQKLDVQYKSKQTPLKTPSQIGIEDIDSTDKVDDASSYLNGKLRSRVGTQSSLLGKSPSPVKEGEPDQLGQTVNFMRASTMKHMLLDALYKKTYQDLKPVLQEKKRLQRNNVFKQDSKQGNKIFQEIYDRGIHSFEALLRERKSNSQQPLQAFQQPPQQETQADPNQKKKKNRKTHSKESGKQLNIDIYQIQNKQESIRSNRNIPSSNQQSQRSHRSKHSHGSSNQPSRLSAQKSIKSVNFGLNIGQTQKIPGMDDVMESVKALKRQISKKDPFPSRQNTFSRKESSPSKASVPSKGSDSTSPMKKGSPIKIAFQKLTNGLAALVDQNIEGPFITDDVRAVMHGLKKKQALASGLSKTQLAVVVDEIKTELDNLKKRASYTSHQLHFLNLVDYYKPIEIQEPKVTKKLTSTNIMINTVSQDFVSKIIKKQLSFDVPKTIEPSIIPTEEISKENPLMKYLKEPEELKIANLVKTSIKSGAVEEELQCKIHISESFSLGQLSKEQIKAHLLDWKTMDTDVKELGNFILGPVSDESIACDLETSSKNGFNILSKFYTTNELIKDEHGEEKSRRTNSAPRFRNFKKKSNQDEKTKSKAGCHFWPKAFECEQITSFNAHLLHTYIPMAGRNPFQSLAALRKEILYGKSVLYDEFWSKNGRMTDLFSSELRMQMKWKVDEEEKINRLEGQILQQIEGMEVYNMIGPKPTDKSEAVVQIEKMFFKKIQFFTPAFLEINQLPDTTHVAGLTDWKLKCINQDALVFKCIGNPNQKTGMTIFADAIKQKIKKTEAAYIEFEDIKMVEPSVDLLWLLYFDEQLIAAMSNILSTPFNPVGVLENLRMELNIVYMNQFEKQMQKIKGKRVKRVGINFKPKRSKLLKGAQQFFGDQVVRRHEAQSKLAVHFLRTKTTVSQASENLINFSEILRPFRQISSSREIFDLKKQFQLPTIYDMKNDISMQPYIIHDIAPLHAIFRNKNDKMLYQDHRKKLAEKIYKRYKSKIEDQAELVSLSLTESSSIEEKDYDSAHTRAHKEPGKSAESVKRKSKPLFYKYAPVQIEQFPYEVDAYGDRVKIIHKDDAVHSLFKEPVRLYQHFSHVSGFQFYRKDKKTYIEITFFDMYVPVRNKNLLSKLQDALRHMLTRKVLEMQQSNAIRKVEEVEEVETLNVPKPSIKSTIPTSPKSLLQAPQPRSKSKSNEKKMKKEKSHKIKQIVSAVTDLKMSKRESKKRVKSANKKPSSPWKQPNLGIDFNSQMQASKRSGRRSNRNSTMKQIIYTHQKKSKNIEAGIANTTPKHENSSRSDHDEQKLNTVNLKKQEEDGQELFRRSTSEIIMNGKIGLQRASSAGPKKSHVPNQHFRRKQDSMSSVSGITESQVSSNQPYNVSEPKVSKFSESASETVDYSPISQSWIRANKEPADPSKPMKLIAAYDLVNKYPYRNVIPPSNENPTITIIGKLFSPKKENEGDIFKKSDHQKKSKSSMMSDFPSSSSEKSKPSRAQKLQKILDDKEKKQKVKQKAARFKSKKQGTSKDRKAQKHETPRINSKESKESESSPDFQLNKSNKASKPFLINPLQNHDEAPKLPKFINKKDLKLKLKK